MEPYQLTLSTAAAQIQAGRLSPVELTNSVLDRIDATQNTLRAFVCVTADLARYAAQAAEREIAAGHYRGPLHGIPLSVKDLYDTAGVPSTSSSKVRAGYVPHTNAVAVERLFDAGMVIVGKTHTHEFAYGVITPISRNPWNPRHIVGGSSGGAAAAVASGGCMVGLGSDTAGSIRIPASLCGTVGLKPTYGRVSRRGVASLAWSLDHIGPLTRNIRDCALVLNTIAGFDRLDPACVDVPVPDYTTGLDQGITGLRVGVPANYFFEHVHDDVATAVRHAINVLQDLGAQVQEVTIPYTNALAAVEFGIVLPEASAYHQQWLRDKGDLYSPDVRLLLEMGKFVLATDYIKALRVRTLIQQGWAAMFDDIDVLVSPSTPLAAPTVDTAEVVWPDGTTENIATALKRLTSPANITGLPALSIPVGFDGAGLPLGMQIIGRPFDEATVLRVGQAYETASHTVGRLAAA
jgi:aspartyl-tRNA(Asn)/glutamyl-tRNA(Gln) amidotransferase subunit A